MERQFGLIKSDLAQLKTRVLPHYPFCQMMFKESKDTKEHRRVFEVKDITRTGMQITLKDGGHTHLPGDIIEGELHWKSEKVQVQCKVKWVQDAKLGVKFKSDETLEGIKNFLSCENVSNALRPVHNQDIGLELPPTLKYWLRADGPVEFFLWQHSDGELSYFQVILFEHFVEWKDGEGVTTGRVMTQRDLDTPLVSEDEFVFKMDEGGAQDRVKMAQNLVDHLNEAHLPKAVIEFLKLKLGQ